MVSRRDILIFGVAASVSSMMAVPGSAKDSNGTNDIIKSLAPRANQINAADSAPLIREPVEIEDLVIYVDPDRQIDLEVYFPHDSARITRRARVTLEDLGEALGSSELSGFRFLVAGHTDSAGSAAYNRDLSKRRAQAVVEYLIATFPIDPNRLVSVGFGESRLKTPEDPRAALNRRVEILLIVP